MSVGTVRARVSKWRSEAWVLDHKAQELARAADEIWRGKFTAKDARRYDALRSAQLDCERRAIVLRAEADKLEDVLAEVSQPVTAI